MTVVIFLIFAFGSGDSKQGSSETSTTTSTSKNTRTVYSGGYPVEIDLNIPSGYEKSGTCKDCDGSGVTHDNGMGKKIDMICAGCAGRGFSLRKLHGSSPNSYTNNISTYSGGMQGDACSLCKGTGIERGWDPVTHEQTGRVCPMCNGNGYTDNSTNRVQYESNNDANVKELNSDEIMPSFKGGEEALLLFMQNNLKFPEICKENNISAKGEITFIVNVDGSIEMLRNSVTASEPYATYFIEEQNRLMYKMPKWNPGTKDGKPVKIEFKLPVRWSLN